MTDSPLPAERGVSNRVAFRCDLEEARAATRTLRTFLAEQGLDDSELFHCELCLAEACNNAVQYATPAAAQWPIVAEAIFHGSGVELRVTDHTEGFELNERPVPVDPRRESGRGLFIIQSMMDEVRYYRGVGRNTLVMRKARTRQQHRPEHDAAVATLEDARRQLASCQQTISGMARELCVRSETLAAIFRCSAELGRTSDLEGFGRRLLTDLSHLTAADWFVLRLVPSGESRLVPFVVSDPALRADSLSLDAAESLLSSELAAAAARREVAFDAHAPADHDEPLRAAGPHAAGLVLPLRLGEKLVGTLAIGRRSGTAFSALEAEMIRTFADFMAVQVINARHVEEQMHARIVAHELDIAHRIQRALLPRALPQPAGFTLAASWESARQVGGDFYDALMLDGHTLLLVVADVMGKGVPAAMFATIMRSLLRALVGRNRRPARLLRRLNELLYEDLSSVGMFITAQLVVVDLAAREVTAASAGHCPVIVMAPDAVQPLRVAGTPLGVLPDSAYREESAPFPSPAGLLLYTDGVTEALNRMGEMFGQERLLGWLRGHTGSAIAADALRDELAAELVRFCGGEPLRDDQAFVVLRELLPVASVASSVIHAATPANRAVAAPTTLALPVPNAAPVGVRSADADTTTTGDFLARESGEAHRQFIFLPTPAIPPTS